MKIAFVPTWAKKVAEDRPTDVRASPHLAPDTILIVYLDEARKVLDKYGHDNVDAVLVRFEKPQEGGE